MKLQEAFKAIREKNLSKDKLEDLHLEISGLLADMIDELASLEKSKAMFMANLENGKSVADRKTAWGATKEGQRLIEMKANVSSTRVMVGSIKTRLFSVY